jgi:hypothetical protein
MSEDEPLGIKDFLLVKTWHNQEIENWCHRETLKVVQLG